MIALKYVVEHAYLPLIAWLCELSIFNILRILQARDNAEFRAFVEIGIAIFNTFNNYNLKFFKNQILGGLP